MANPPTQQEIENEFRNREITVKESELTLKKGEVGHSRWSSPLVLAIAGAVVAGVFGIWTAWWNSRAQLAVEREKAEFDRRLETTKAEAQRVLEMIKTNNDPDRAASNLKFLLDAGLVSDPNTRNSLTAFLKNRPSGSGPSLPASVASASVDVDPLFKQIQITVPQLGKPRLPAVLEDDAYQAVYDNANILWLQSLLTILVLPDDASKKTIWQADADWAKDQRLFDDASLRAQFPGVPEGKYPPHGGVAYYWLNNPDQWKWVGWRVWYCRFFKQVRYQQFENGAAFGVFHLNPAQDQGQIFVVFNDGKWLSRVAGGSAPKCLADPLPHSGP